MLLPHVLPCVALSVSSRFISVDKFNNYLFALSEDNFNLVNSRLDKVHGKFQFRPLKTYNNPSTGRTYYNLIVKSKNIPSDLQRLINKKESSDMTIYISFTTWAFEKTTGFRVKINNIVLNNPDPIEDEDNHFFHCLI